jgi:hypothetical protein
MVGWRNLDRCDSASPPRVVRIAAMAALVDLPRCRRHYRRWVLRNGRVLNDITSGRLGARRGVLCRADVSRHRSVDASFSAMARDPCARRFARCDALACSVRCCRTGRESVLPTRD